PSAANAGLAPDASGLASGPGPMLTRTRTVAPRRESQPHESRPHEAQSHEHEGVPMTDNFAAGPQTTQLWERVRPTVAQIEDLPFPAQLADASLALTALTHNTNQAGTYLHGYSKAVFFRAAKTVAPAVSRFWPGTAAEAITAEEGLPEDRLADSRLAAAYSEISGGTPA